MIAQVVCGGCNDALDDSYFIDGDRYYHANCVPACSCDCCVGKKIDAPSVTANMRPEFEV
jgi:hypothetical protein